MRYLALALALFMQVPPEAKIRIAPPPLPSVPRAAAVLRGVRILDVRPDGVYFLGSACPVGGFDAYTALHVVAEAKGQLVALPNHGHRAGPEGASRVHIVWKDDKHDLARIVPDSADEAFLTWYPRGPVPLAGAEVRGVLILPPPATLAVPTFGTFYGEDDGWLWGSQVSGPGSSGSCVLDDLDRVFAILTATASWGNEGVAPSNMPRASVFVRIPD